MAFKINISKILDKSLRLQGLFLIAVIVLCSWLEFSGQISSFRYDRYLIETGQWYRLITANFVHLNEMHLLMNMLGVGLVVFFFSGHLKLQHWVSLIILSSVSVTLGLYLFNADVHRYVGMSGVLHGLFIAAAFAEMRRYPLSGWLLLIVLVLKLAWEQKYGAMPGSESMIKGNVVVDSHLYGAIAGLVFVIIPLVVKRIK